MKKKLFIFFIVMIGIMMFGGDAYAKTMMCSCNTGLAEVTPNKDGKTHTVVHATCPRGTNYTYTENHVGNPCSRCGYSSSSGGGSSCSHSYGSWYEGTYKNTPAHIRECTKCDDFQAHMLDFRYSTDSLEICGGHSFSCTITRSHSLSDWNKDSSNHWKTCSNSCCSGRNISLYSHNYNVTSATCTTRKYCTTCGYEQSPALGHVGGSATCQNPAICTRCGVGYGGTVGHNYITPCTEKHCGGVKCGWCGTHKGACNGGCTYTTCSHCKYYYCTRCESHSCSCNTNMSCSNPHCIAANIRWCSYCGSHNSHVGCNTNAICSQPHCSQRVCSVCGGNHQGACGGGHIYTWVTNTTTSESQTHTYKCTVTSSCTATNGRHTASWNSANSSHKSVCKHCSLTYTHPAKWSTAQRNATEPHPCVWAGGCTATHSPSWGQYYKVNTGSSTGNSGNGNGDGGSHTRKCAVCGITEKYHTYSTEAWIWTDKTNHTKTCKVCGLTQVLNHRFNQFAKKDYDSINHSELYKHWKLCVDCDVTHKEADEEHIDNGAGRCQKCDQVLWKIIDDEGNDITTDIINKVERRATDKEVIRILEVVNDGSGNPKLQYIKVLRGPETLNANASNIITITKNGDYQFTTGRGGTVKITIDNISRDILIDKIISPNVSTAGVVKIIIRTNKAEEKYNKEIYIKEGNNLNNITNSEVEANGDNPYQIEKTVTENGVYTFIARDTAGNSKIITVTIDNIVRGQATVAISNDVFTNGFIFTEILVNPNQEWNWNLSEDANTKIIARSYSLGNTSGTLLGKNNIKVVKIMDSQRNVAKKNINNKYLPGSYYIQVAIGGSIFRDAGTYIIDLENVDLGLSDLGLNEDEGLDGKNRIVVEVQSLKDLT